MLTIILGTAVVILTLLVVLVGYCLAQEVWEHEDLKRRHEVLRDQHYAWVRRAVRAEREIEEAAECARHPEGWTCSRGPHADGPCAASETAPPAGTVAA